MDEEMDQLSEEELARERRINTLAKLGQSLASKKDICVDAKSDIEARWMRDERQYWGVNWNGDGDNRSAGKVEDINDYQFTDKKTFQKTRTIAARIGDMLFPTNDKNWAISPTPNPTDMEGNPLPDDVAEVACQQIEDNIDDALTECGYAKAGRKAIFDGCRIGTGVMKGPFTRGQTRRRLMRTQVPVINPYTGEPAIDPETGEPITEPGPLELKVFTQDRPAAGRVDPWMWFPMPARNVEECEGSFELHLKNKQALIDMVKWPGFMEDQLRKLASMEPDQGKERSLLNQRRDLLRSNNEALDNTYTVWEYHGPIDKEDLEAIGIEISDPLEQVFGEVWFCQGIVLKVELSAVIDDHRIPYYVWCFEEDEADIFGYGVPFVMRDEAMILDVTLNAMIYNAQLTAGPQSIEFGPNKVKPADNNHEIRGPKHWIAVDEDITDLKQALQFHYIENSIGNIQPVYELAKQNADENTMLPMIAQGEATNSVPTSSGMAMLMNASNIVQRMAAHSWDDNITVPLITRMYYWEMQFGENDEIKMDVNVDARGASYLLVKDMQAQHGMMLLQMAGQDPELRATLDMDETYKTVINFLDVPTDRLFKTDQQKQQEAEGMQAQQALAQRREEAEIAKLEAEAQEAAAKAAAVGTPDQPNNDAYFKYLSEREEREVRLVIAQMERDGDLARAAAEQNVKLEDLMVRLQIAEKDQATKQRLAEQKEFIEGMKVRLQMEKSNQRQQNLAQGYDTF